MEVLTVYLVIAFAVVLGAPVIEPSLKLRDSFILAVFWPMWVTICAVVVGMLLLAVTACAIFVMVLLVGFIIATLLTMVVSVVYVVWYAVTTSIKGQ